MIQRYTKEQGYRDQQRYNDKDTKVERYNDTRKNHIRIHKVALIQGYTKVN